mmetsp:Transcript_4099/g.9571  ORF Transcript_4099/g.9571 Transcript_4099/m.9571 type:complete len:153 (+) Transcript_4099:45-503(+)
MLPVRRTFGSSSAHVEAERGDLETQAASCLISESHPDRSAELKSRTLVMTFLKAHGFLHVNDSKTRFGRKRYPLHVAASQNKPAVVKALLQLGARPNVKTRRGLTPEDFAKRGQHESILQLLREPWQRAQAPQKEDAALEKDVLGVGSTVYI